MLTQEVVSLLACPTCRTGALSRDASSDPGTVLERGKLVCEVCHASYPVEFGIPALLPRGRTDSAAWELWREHLAKYEARRQDREAHPQRRVTRWMRKSRPQRAFARFTGITRGRLLDVGCGSGKFRLKFDPALVTYVGVDPMALPEARDFAFVRGLAEYLPFATGAFTDVAVLAALDHFREPGRFFDEAARVLAPGGRLHILQSVHEVRGPISAVKVLGHRVKDALENLYTSDHDRSVPKHLNEFTPRTLLQAAAPRFRLAAESQYSGTWYAPTKYFVTLTPVSGEPAAGKPGHAAAVAGRS